MRGFSLSSMASREGGGYSLANLHELGNDDIEMMERS